MEVVDVQPAMEKAGFIVHMVREKLHAQIVQTADVVLVVEVVKLLKRSTINKLLHK